MNPKEVKKHKLLDVCELVAGSRANKSETGIFPIYSAGVNPIGMSDEANCPAGSIRLTKKGTIGNVYLHDEPFWVSRILPAGQFASSLIPIRFTPAL